MIKKDSMPYNRCARYLWLQPQSLHLGLGIALIINYLAMIYRDTIWYRYENGFLISFPNGQKQKFEEKKKLLKKKSIVNLGRDFSCFLGRNDNKCVTIS